jgi:hypothetical protein
LCSQFLDVYWSKRMRENNGADVSVSAASSVVVAGRLQSQFAVDVVYSSNFFIELFSVKLNMEN